MKYFLFVLYMRFQDSDCRKYALNFSGDLKKVRIPFLIILDSVLSLTYCSPKELLFELDSI